MRTKAGCLKHWELYRNGELVLTTFRNETQEWWREFYGKDEDWKKKYIFEIRTVVPEGFGNRIEQI